MFKRFAICLAPLFITGLIFLFFGQKMANKSDLSLELALIILLISIGALLSAFYVGRPVYRGITDPVWLKYFAAILVFLIVAIGYAGLGLFGGCMMLLVSSK